MCVSVSLCVGVSGVDSVLCEWCSVYVCVCCEWCVVCSTVVNCARVELVNCTYVNAWVLCKECPLEGRGMWMWVWVWQWEW